MVSFTCDACGNTVKKNQVEKHYLTKCRNCSVLSCIDCGVDFPGDTYMAHTSCISEAQKYQGNLYQPKDRENKGQAKQEEWTKQLQQATDNIKDTRLKPLLNKISEYSNVPRKKKKFENFCRNSVRVYDEKTLDALWEVFSGAIAKPVGENGNQKESVEEDTKPQQNEDSDNEDTNKKKGKRKKKRKLENTGDSEQNDDNESTTKKKKKKKMKHSDDEQQGDQNTESTEVTEEHQLSLQNGTGKFHWHKAIKIALKESDDRELSIKKLRKKVISAYEEHGFDHRSSSREENKVVFEKKLKTYPKIKISKNIVKLL